MKAFSLIETMVALALGGVIAATVVATFAGAEGGQGKSKREWAAFTIAQQRMELLNALPKNADLLAANSVSVSPGAQSDMTCTDIPLAANSHYRANEFGDPVANGQFDVCQKVTDGNPIGALKNVRVVVLYDFGGTDGIMLQSIR